MLRSYGILRTLLVEYRALLESYSALLIGCRGLLIGYRALSIHSYGVATISRLLKIICLLFKRAL